MNHKLLKLLLAGEYLCPVRYPMEFNLLTSVTEQAEANAWAGHLNLRLARTSEDGAFFFAPNFIDSKDVTQVKNELAKFRDEYGPAVLLLDFIRQADGGRVQLTPGELIALYVLEGAVAQSSMLENQLKSLLGVITNAAMRNTNRENLGRLLDHLVRDGYVVLANKDLSTYQVTWKIEQLYAVLQFLDENKVVPDTEIDDTEETPEDLVDMASADEETGS